MVGQESSSNLQTHSVFVVLRWVLQLQISPLRYQTCARGLVPLVCDNHKHHIHSMHTRTHIIRKENDETERKKRASESSYIVRSAV